MKKYVVASMAAILLTGCSGSVSVGGTSVKQADLEKKVAGQITGADADKLAVTCDGDLKGEKGETQECTIDDGAGGRSLVKPEVTEVDGDKVTFDTLVFIAAEDVESEIEKQLTSQGEEVESVTCDEDLPGEVGEEIECAAEPIGDLVVSTTAVDGLRVNFSLAQK